MCIFFTIGHHSKEEPQMENPSRTLLARLIIKFAQFNIRNKTEKNDRDN